MVTLLKVIFYLAPGDYHGFHAPTDWRVEERHHFEGLLLSVGPSVVRAVRDLFTLNERVIYRGRWQDDLFFSFSAVGATNVGSIEVPADGSLTTNSADGRPGSFPPKTCKFQSGGFEVQRGEAFGTFNLGSTIVLIFEVPSDVQAEMAVQAGQRVRMGEAVLRFYQRSSPEKAGG